MRTIRRVNKKLPNVSSLGDEWVVWEIEDDFINDYMHTRIDMWRNQGHPYKNGDDGWVYVYNLTYKRKDMYETLSFETRITKDQDGLIFSYASSLPIRDELLGVVLDYIVNDEHEPVSFLDKHLEFRPFKKRRNINYEDASN